LRNPAVTAAIVGARKPEQVDDMVSAAEIRLTESDLKEVESGSRNSRLSTSRREMKIGFIGLGIMGSRMAANLQKAGHSLVVYNRTSEKAEPLLAGGAEWADSPAALAAQVE
jgi:phosphoglycerate dehydrogenase-like enzyme